MIRLVEISQAWSDMELTILGRRLFLFLGDTQAYWLNRVFVSWFLNLHIWYVLHDLRVKSQTVLDTVCCTVDCRRTNEFNILDVKGTPFISRLFVFYSYAGPSLLSKLSLSYLQQDHSQSAGHIHTAFTSPSSSCHYASTGRNVSTCMDVCWSDP